MYELPLGPIILNISTTTYEIAGYSTILSPLTRSGYTASSSQESTVIIKLKSISEN